MDVAALRGRFRERFGSEARVFRAPGRVNLIGEHTDYSAGFVMPVAIGMATYVAAAPRPGEKLIVHSENYCATEEIDAATAKARKHWTDYIAGVAVELFRMGLPLVGADLLISGEVPLGAGLSSSAALEVATALTLLAMAGKQARPSEIALICQRAENNFVGARCGIMDQFIACHGRSGHALMLDCRSFEFQQIPIPEGIAVVACNTQVRHAIAGGEYNLRRQQCESAAQRLGVAALRDITMAEFKRRERELPEPERRRARHVIGENARVGEFAHALAENDRLYMGHLMEESHRSLRNDFEVSCPELDIMVDIAGQVEGTIGARMTGGGFGDCTVNLVQEDAVDAFREFVAPEYERQTGKTPEIYAMRAADGAGEVTEAVAS
jgi:galactokinase